MSTASTQEFRPSPLFGLWRHQEIHSAEEVTSAAESILGRMGDASFEEADVAKMQGILAELLDPSSAWPVVLSYKLGPRHVLVYAEEPGLGEQRVVMQRGGYALWNTFAWEGDGLRLCRSRILP